MVYRRKTAKGALWTGAVLAVVLAAILPSAAFAEETEKPPTTRALGPLEKSLLFPGWGQLAERRILKGAAFAAAELAFLAEAIHFNGRGNSAYAQYQAAGDAASAVRCRKLVERYDSRRNACLLAAAAVWAINLLDIHLIVNRKETGANPRSLSVGIIHAPPHAIGLSLDCRF